MRSRNLWLLCFLLAGIGLACGGSGLYLAVKQVDAGIYMVIFSGVPIVIAALLAALAFHKGLKGH
jgi:drug/metabolite transporter (DMT)-like permease